MVQIRDQARLSDTCVVSSRCSRDSTLEQRFRPFMQFNTAITVLWLGMISLNIFIIAICQGRPFFVMSFYEGFQLYQLVDLVPFSILVVCEAYCFSGNCYLAKKWAELKQRHCCCHSSPESSSHDASPQSMTLQAQILQAIGNQQDRTYVENVRASMMEMSSLFDDDDTSSLRMSLTLTNNPLSTYRDP